MNDEQRILDRVEFWKRRLIDLSRRNRLLSFRETKTGSVILDRPHVGELYNRLVIEGTSLKFVRRDASRHAQQVDLTFSDDELNHSDLIRTEKSNAQSELLRRLVILDDQIPEELIEAAKTAKENAISLQSGEVVCRSGDERTEKSLYNIRLKARSSLEEQGINVLFVALGFLEWYEADSSDRTFKSPLVLVPAQLDRDSTASRRHFEYVLKPIDEEVVINPTLTYKLEHDFKIQLPPFSLDESNGSIGEYLRQINDLVEERDNWSVVDESVLAILSFHKFAMFQDLARLQDRILDHGVVRGICGVPTELPDPDIPSPRGLDEEIPPQDTYQILDADSSQQQAIVAAKRGASFVLQGPPGTGKSQTIANIIGECLATGKRVLFVSEKMAALEVVKRRLDSCGLGQFCLEVHSHKASKKQVLQQLEEALNAPRGGAGQADLERLEQLQQTRRTLNEYITALQTPALALGWSPYRVTGEIARLAHAPNLRFDVPDPSAVDRPRLTEIESVLDQAARYPDVISQWDDHPWVGSAIEHMDLRLREELEDFFEEVTAAVGDLEEQCESFREATPFVPCKVAHIQQIVAGLSRYSISVFDRDLEQLVTRLEQSYSGFLRLFMPEYWKDMRWLVGTMRGQRHFGLFDVHKARAEVSALLDLTKSVPVQGDLTGFGRDGDQKFIDRWLEDTKPRLRTVGSGLHRLRSDLFSGWDLQIDGSALEEATLSRLREWLDLKGQRLDALRDWIAYRSVSRSAHRLGLGDFLEKAIADRVEVDSLKSAFLKRFFRVWLDQVTEERVVLRELDSRRLEALREEFKRLDREQCEIARRRIQDEITKRQPRFEVSAPSAEMQILRRELNKKRRHKPIRRLFTEVPTVLSRYKPCLMMSPLSVAMFLEAEQHAFDLVIFDEASQVLPEDAIGAIVRGEHLVVVGDNRQLPPTPFFQKLESDTLDEDELEDVEGFESILDLASPVLLELELLWHYRSRHEDLIAFSNYWFYKNRLQTFPASDSDSGRLGVSLEFVDGVYDAGKSRTNNREAERVAELVFEHAENRPGKTLGVVAFSEAQMMAILQQIELSRLQSPELVEFFNEEKIEPFFVKNLENVQGDERDVMIFSVGYGKDSLGRMALRFGPLNMTGGERRLNVAVTRARETVKVVASIDAADIDLSRTQAEGVHRLRHYLEYALNGPSVLPGTVEAPGEGPESVFEEAVLNALEARGYQVDPQVGCSGYRVDLAIKDPDKPGRYLLGIECDGATYHSSFTARERDRLRQEVLESLGWRIHRIWSRDWIEDPVRELEKIGEAVRRARESLDRVGEPPVLGEPPPANPPSPLEETNLPPGEMPEPPAESTEPPPGMQYYRIAPSPLRGKPGPQASRASLKRCLEQVVDIEGPIEVDLAYRRVADHVGISRIGSRVRERLDAALSSLLRQGSVIRRGRFLWPALMRVDDVPVRLPTPGAEFSRTVDQIPTEELQRAALVCLHSAGSMETQDLIVEIARLFGFSRTGNQIQDRVTDALVELARAEAIRANGDRVFLKNE